MTQILVVGLLDVDAGKTILAYSLAKALTAEGFKVSAHKPVGATDIWRSPWVIRESEERRVVVLGDAVILSNALEHSMPIELVNPLALILAPVDPTRFEWHWTPYSTVMGSSTARAALSRITYCSGDEIVSRHLINPKAIERAPKSIAERLFTLAGRLRPPPEAAGEAEVSRIISSVGAVDSCLDAGMRGYEVSIIESYSDISVPVPRALESDIVLVVTHGSMGVIQGSR